MSRKSIPHPRQVIEWSPRGVGVLDPSSRSVRRFDSATGASTAIGGQPVVVAVSRRAMFVRTMRVPNASHAEIEMIVRMKLGELFPLPAHDLAYSVELTDDMSMEGRLAVVAAMSAIELRRLYEDLRSAGIKVHSVIPIAYGSVVLASNLSHKNCAIASRDEGGIGIDIVQDGHLYYSRVAPPSGKASAEVCRTYSVAGIPCGDIIAADGLLIDEADVTSAASPLEALSGVWPTFVPTLELPEIKAQIESRKLTTKRSLAAAIFVVGLAIAGFGYLDYAKAASSAADAQSKLDGSLKTLKSDQSAAEVAANAATAAQNVVRRGFQPPQTFSDIIGEMVGATPQNLWLTGFTLERGKSLSVRGMSTDPAAVTSYIDNLSDIVGDTGNPKDPQEPRFRDVKMAAANNAKIDQQPVVQFSLTAFPQGNLPLVDKATKKGGAK